MKIRLAEFPSSFYAWFFTPLLTFCIVLLGPRLDLGPWTLFVTPVVGCVGLALWLSRSSLSTNAFFLLKVEFMRALYIFVIGFIFAWWTSFNPSVGDALSHVVLLFVLSFFFYLIPDIFVIVVNGLLRRYIKKLPWGVLVFTTILLGILAYYGSYTLISDGFLFGSY